MFNIARSRLCSVGLAAAVLAVSPWVAPSASAQSKASQTFIKKAIQGNYAEIQMGELAQQKGQSDAVKSYGQMLITEHGDANKKAMQAASDMKVSAPTGPNSKQKAEHDKMAGMSGAAFDKAFAKGMVKDHKMDIADYRKESTQKDQAGQYAVETLPTLQKHLESAAQLAK